MRFKFSTTTIDVEIKVDHLDIMYRILSDPELSVPNGISEHDRQLVVDGIKKVFVAHKKMTNISMFSDTNYYAALQEPTIVDETFPVTAKLER